MKVYTTPKGNEYTQEDFGNFIKTGDIQPIKMEDRKFMQDVREEYIRTRKQK